MHIVLRLILLLILTCSLIFFHSIVGVFAIIPFWIMCGLIDVSRHKTMNLKLLKRYFLGKGTLTFLMSPLNLFSDLISHRNLHFFKIEDFPSEFQDEIKTVKKIFDQNKKSIEERFSQSEDNRAMLFYKWYGKNLDESIDGFTKDFKYIKTIGVSLFREKTSTSRHFGPLRLTYRLLYNFNKVKKTGSYIEADGTINIWKNDPLFIFDDTLIHQSFNQEDCLRYCAFIDILRPGYSNSIITALLSTVGFLLKKSRGIFYKNWKMI
jgi:aspartyl/asparaginyl beta-hydroxylase (cupin superfamily)